MNTDDSECAPTLRSPHQNLPTRAVERNSCRHGEQATHFVDHILARRCHKHAEAIRSSRPSSTLTNDIPTRIKHNATIHAHPPPEPYRRPHRSVVPHASALFATTNQKRVATGLPDCREELPIHRKSKARAI